MKEFPRSKLGKAGLVMTALLGLAEANAAELLVKFRDGPESAEALRANASIGSEVVKTFQAIGWQKVRLPEGMSANEGVASYRKLESVITVERNGAGSSGFGSGTASNNLSARPRATAAAPVPNDPSYASQWGLKTIRAPDAWAITTGSKDVVVAVIDTGVNYKHEDLKDNMWRNPGEAGLDADGKDKAANGVDDDANGYVDDVFGIDPAGNDSDPMDEGVFEPRIYHGTFCAGIIGASGNNGRGITGINWTTQIMAIRVADAQDVFRAGAMLEAFDYIIKMKRRGVNIRVTNNSYGGDNSGEAIRDAMEIAGREGILHVVAAGNAGVNTDYSSGYPRNFPLTSIIVVTASTQSDQLPLNYGKTSVDLAAPGGSFRSAYGPNANSYYDFSGVATSFATPQVTGAAALLLSANPNLTMEEVKAALLHSVDAMPSMKGRVVTNGRLNIGRALQNAGAELPPIVINASPWTVKDPANPKVTVTFSKPMNRPSVESAWQMSPAAPGRFEWTEDGKTVFFTPNEPLLTLTNYVVMISSAATEDLSGAGLDGNFDRISDRTQIDDFQWTFRLPPANDDVYYAQLIEGVSGELAGTNANASKEGRELDKAGNAGGASVWYRWVAPESGPMTFETLGSGFDTLLAVGFRDANHLEQDIIRGVPTFITANDNFGTNKTSRVSFLASEGKSYVVGVDGKALTTGIPPAATGDFILRWFPTPQPLRVRGLADGRLEISWAANALGYVLQSSDALDGKGQWADTAQNPVVSGTSNIVTVETPENARFYRLRKP